MGGVQVAFYEMTPGKWDWRAALPAVVELAWPDLVSVLGADEASPCTAASCAGKKCPHKMRSGDGGAWSPVVLKEAWRDNDNVEAVTALVLDGDALSTEQLARVAEKLSGTAFAAHTTHRHRAGAIFVRFVVQLSRPVSAEEWPRFYPTSIGYLGLDGVFDPTCKDLSRLYFLPTHPSDVPFLFESRDGAPLDVDAVLARAGTAPASPPNEDYAPEHDASTVEYTDIGAVVAQLGVYKRKRARGTAEEKERAELIGRLLAGEPLAAPGGNADPTPVSPPESLPKGRGYAIMRAARICTTFLPENVPDEAYLEIFRRSLDAMCFGRYADRDEMETHLLEKLKLGREKRRQFDEEAKARNTATKSFQVALAEERARERKEKVTQGSPLLDGTLDWTPAPEEPVEDDSAWMSSLQMRKDGDGLVATGLNAYLILKHAGELRGAFRWNDVTLEIEGFGVFADVEPEVFDVRAANYLAQKWGLTLRTSEVYRQILAVAYERRFDPIRDYLRALRWDGLDRINGGDGWLVVYAGASAEEMWSGYVREVGRKWLVSAAARALQPGCKVDTVLILRGDQGKRKSSMLEVLGGPFYADVALALADKDAKMLAARSWISELPDLAALKRASEQNAIKAFFSTAEDTFRPPYARTQIKSPRRNVFAGTTNDDEFLIDWTGNRRYWPVRCEGQVDLAAVIRDRDQLWAQAVYLYNKHVKECVNKLECCCWWFSKAEAELVEKISTQYVYESEHAIAILEWWDSMAPAARPQKVTTNQVAKDAMKYTQDRITRGTLMAIGPALTKLGFKKTRKPEGGMFISVFVPSEELLARPQSETGKSAFKLLQGGKGEKKQQ